MRSTLATVLTIALLATGALVAVDLATVFGPATSITASDWSDAAHTDDERVVRGFYDAANALLAGEDVLVLAAVVAPLVETHFGREAPSIGQEALAERLVAMQGQGGIRLSVVQLIGGGDNLTTLIEAHGVVQPERENSGGKASPLWRTIDRFRIEDGMIAAYWPGAIESRPLPPLPAMTVTAAPEHAAIALARLELGPEVTLRPLVTPFPQLLLVENGTLLVSRREALAVARAGDEQFIWLPPMPIKEEMLLGPGDALFVPAGAGQAISNPDDRPASALSMLFAPSPTLHGPKHDLAQDTLTAIALHDPARIGRRTAWAIGVTAETLTVGEFPDTAQTTGTMELRGDHLALEPGEDSQPLMPSPLTFMIVQSGTLNVQIETESPSGATVATPLPDPIAEYPGNRLLRAGDAMTVEPGEAATVVNAGAARLDLMLIAVDILEGAASPAPG